jgi:hypothetical protein
MGSDDLILVSIVFIYLQFLTLDMEDRMRPRTFRVACRATGYPVLQTL